MKKRHRARPHFRLTAAIVTLAIAWLLSNAVSLCAQEAKFSFTEGYYQPSATTGPTFPSWSPDGKQLAFAMEGSIWTVGVNGGEAAQVTSGPTYDSQPQWSPDGKSILYDSDFGTITELFAVDVASRQARQLTRFGRVTLDPRWSPDGKTIVFTSGSTGTWSTGGSYFNIYTMSAEGGEPVAIVQSRGQRGEQANPPAENIEPTFSSDGKSILFLSRRPAPDGAVVIGSGWFWQIPVTGGEPKLIHREETLYSARPAISPDGSRIAYISFLRGKNSLTVLPASGGAPLAVTYQPGKTEEFHPAWSPDSSQITFVDNSDGSHTALWVIGANGGVARRVEIRSRKYAYPVGQVKVTIANPDGDAAARIYLQGSNGKSYFPLNSFHREQSATGDHYTHVDGEFVVTLPAGNATIEAMKGFEYAPVKTTVEVRANQTTTATLTLHRIVNMPAAGWWSGDNHVHGEYGGMLNITPEVVGFMERAEDLNVIHDLICNRDNRIFDIPYFEGKPNEQVSRPGRILYYSEEYRPGFYGHVGMLGLKQFVWPFYNGERGTAWGPSFPTNADALDMAHAAGGYGGPWHMINYAEDPEENNYSGGREAPVDVALGKADFVEILSLWSNQTSNAKLWYRFLNAGFHVPITSGTDSFPNFDRNPAVGAVRVYTHAGPQLSYDGWMKALVAGRSFVTSGPLLQFTVDGHEPGDSIQLPESGKASVTVHARVDSIFPMSELSIVRNGKVVESMDLTNVQSGGHAELTRTIDIPESGWLALRVEGDGKPHHGLMKSAVFAHTAAVYVMRGSRPTPAAESAGYFIKWIDRSIELIKSEKDWNSPADKQHAIDIFQRARDVYERMLNSKAAGPGVASERRGDYRHPGAIDFPIG
jgi:TolB protein